MRVIDCFQNSQDWMAARNGRITASRICDVMKTLKKGGEGAERRNYRIELVAERLTGFNAEHFTSPEMKWGSDQEDFAREAYAEYACVKVNRIGFALHPTMDFSGASPDGLVGANGCIESKSPKTETHVKWMMAGTVPEEHQEQMLWVMRCCERQWCDFISFDSRLPDGLKLFVVRMQRDDERISKIEAEVIRFNDEVNAVIEELSKQVTTEQVWQLSEDSSTVERAPESMDAWVSEFDRMTSDEGMAI